MRNREFLIFCLIIGLALTFVVTPNLVLAAEPKSLKIGATYPLTGHAAIYGVWMKDGAMCAVEELKEKGGPKIELIVEDNAGETTKAVNAFNKLVRMDKVPYILTGFSKIVMGTAPIANQNKVIVLNTSASSPDLVKAGPYVFSDLPNLTYEIKALARYVKGNLPQIKTLATFVVNDVFGLGARDAVLADFEAVGIKILGGEFMEFQGTSYKTQLAKLKALNADAIYMAHYGKEDMILAFKQAKELGIETQWLGFQGMATPGVWEESNGGNEGAIFTQAPFDPQSDNSITKEFVTRYQKKVGKLPELYAANGYDAVFLFKNAVDYINKKKMALSGENIRKAFLDVKTFNTSSGTLIFQDNGTCIKPIAIRKVVKGKFEDITILPAAK